MLAIVCAAIVGIRSAHGELKLNLPADSDPPPTPPPAQAQLPGAPPPKDARIAAASPIATSEPVIEPEAASEEFVGDADLLGEEDCDRVWYVEADYLHWWLSGDSTPPLVTTSTVGTPRNQAGILGLPTTTVLYGGDQLNDEAHSGARIVFGRWLTECARLEGNWFELGETQSEFRAASPETPILARPFFNVVTGLQDAFLVAYPNIRNGSVAVDSTSRFMGAGISIIENWNPCCEMYGVQLGAECGLRYLRLEEGISISDAFTSVDPAGPVPVGTQFTTADQFDTTNDFFGFNLGMRGEWQHERWSLTCITNLGIGETIRTVKINGRSSTTTPAGLTTNFNGGLLALPTNIGDYRNTELGIVPQLQLKVGYNVTTNVRLIAGYDVMLWNSVARPGDQIDTNVNTTQTSGQPLVGEAAPVFTFRESVLWVQGASLGAEWRF